MCTQLLPGLRFRSFESLTEALISSLTEQTQSRRKEIKTGKEININNGVNETSFFHRFYETTARGMKFLGLFNKIRLPSAHVKFLIFLSFFCTIKYTTHSIITFSLKNRMTKMLRKLFMAVFNKRIQC